MFQLEDAKTSLVYGSYHLLKGQDVFIYLNPYADEPKLVFSREFQDYLGGLPKKRWETYDQVAEKLNQALKDQIRVSYL